MKRSQFFVKNFPSKQIKKLCLINLLSFMIELVGILWKYPKKLERRSFTDNFFNSFLNWRTLNG